MDLRKATKWFTIDSIITSVIFIAIGALFLLLPNSFSNLLVIISGVLFIFGGIAALIYFFAGNTTLSAYGLAIAIILIVLGIFGVTHINLIKGVLSYFFGIFILISGAIYMSKSVDNLRKHMGNCLPQLIMSLIVLALGIVVLFGNFSTIMVFTGIALIVVGVFSIIMSLVFQGQVNSYAKNNRPAGPHGPQGPQGPMGPEGPMGGPQGPIDSDWHEVH